jgi:hypothetical protein
VIDSGWKRLIIICIDHWLIKMPQSEGYMFLNEGNVYNSTTEPTKTYSVLDTVKRVVGQAIGSNETLLSADDEHAR